MVQHIGIRPATFWSLRECPQEQHRRTGRTSDRRGCDAHDSAHVAFPVLEDFSMHSALNARTLGKQALASLITMFLACGWVLSQQKSGEYTFRVKTELVLVN